MINWLRTGIILLAACGYAFAQQGRPVGPNPTATGTAATGQIPGTATNDNANAGNVGEYLSAVSDGFSTATITVTIASPAVVTWTGHPFVIGNGVNLTSGGAAAINFTTNGALPTGITAGTQYYVIGSTITANTFQIATSAANAVAGTAVNTSGTQSGTQTGIASTINLSSGTYKTVAAITLTAGDWDVTGTDIYVPATGTSATRLFAGTGISDAVDGTLGTYAEIDSAATILTGLNPTMPSPLRRISLGAPGAVYFGCRATFSVSTLACGGFVRARRVR